MVLDNLKFHNDKGYYFDFNLTWLNENIEKMLDWKSEFGLFPGRCLWLFPEFSN